MKINEDGDGTVPACERVICDFKVSDKSDFVVFHEFQNLERL